MNRKEALKYAKFRLECYSKGDEEYTEHGEFLVAAIEALQEPERKKGQWIGDFDHSKYNDWHCSNCGKYYPERNKKLLGDYCPWCGADMRG